MKATVRADITASKNLVTISKKEIAGEMVNSVDARELHIKLGSKQQFADWIGNRIKKYGFIENMDFHKIMKPNECNKTDYILTIDTAKEIAMVENNEKGKEIRRYFIEIEKQFNQTQPSLLQKKLNIKDLTREELEDFAQYVLDKYHEVNENNIYFRQSANKWFDNMNEAISQNLSMKDELEILRKEKENFKQLALDTSKQESEYLAYSFEAVGKELGLSRNKVFDFARLFCMIKKDNMPTKYFKDNFRIIDTEYKSGNGIRKYKQPMFLESGKEIFKKKLQKFLPQTI